LCSIIADHTFSGRLAKNEEKEKREKVKGRHVHFYIRSNHQEVVALNVEMRAVTIVIYVIFIIITVTDSKVLIE
jgi:hypothetical protein